MIVPGKQLINFLYYELDKETLSTFTTKSIILSLSPFKVGNVSTTFVSCTAQRIDLGFKVIVFAEILQS